MTLPMDWDPTPVKTKKRPALDVPAPFGVRPFEGVRNPLTRSNSAHRVSFAMPTPANEGVPQIYHFESEAEFSVALEASMDPGFYHLEVQLPAIRYPWKAARKGYRNHYFDQRLTFNDGYRRAVYIKNGKGLRSEKTQAEINAIFECIGEEFADDAIVVNTDDYSRARRDNLRRIWWLSQQHRPGDDEIVLDAAQTTSYWLLQDLVAQCAIPPSDAWQASMRLIGRGILGADWDAVITLNSRVWLQ